MKAVGNSGVYRLTCVHDVFQKKELTMISILADSRPDTECARMAKIDTLQNYPDSPRMATGRAILPEAQQFLPPPRRLRTEAGTSYAKHISLLYRTVFIWLISTGLLTRTLGRRHPIRIAANKPARRSFWPAKAERRCQLGETAPFDFPERNSYLEKSASGRLP